MNLHSFQMSLYPLDIDLIFLLLGDEELFRPNDDAFDLAISDCRFSDDMLLFDVNVRPVDAPNFDFCVIVVGVSIDESLDN
ncbi:hypothetical protein DERF_007362 [Dermatophagoides farinae]|uniref:Uncharacterized protein n=1 Tax=Dermatophagoides farinae TaxID=6954 RepID=A0A922I0X5_DERFA|nr:hypothetical protein DERF_007362 [Dermatophagoides farinae]